MWPASSLNTDLNKRPHNQVYEITAMIREKDCSPASNLRKSTNRENKSFKKLLSQICNLTIFGEKMVTTHKPGSLLVTTLLVTVEDTKMVRHGSGPQRAYVLLVLLKKKESSSK